MFFLYQIIISLIILFSPIVIIYRIYNHKEDKKRFIEKFAIPTKKRVNGKLIWFHGSSVGEILSIIPLIKYYEKKNSIKQILITSSTLSSSKVIKKFKFKKTLHQFFPIDHLYIVNKFLNHWKPNVAIFVESEIWPCIFKKINKNNIPLILLNARLTKKTFNRWNTVKSFSKTVFDYISLACPQNYETKNYLKKLNLKKIKYIGNLKFAETNYNSNENLKETLKTQLLAKKIWIASSTHDNEEIYCAKAHQKLKKKIKNLITIIIPRHVHRVKEIVKEIKHLNLKTITHSSKIKNLKNIDIYIVDTFGETHKFHKIGATVYLGGSMINRGGQNPLEAARFGAQILHGPHTGNFNDVYKFLKLLKVSKKINSINQLASSITFKKNKKAGFKIKNIGEKILKKTIKELNSII